MTPIYIVKWKFIIQKTNVGIKKINSLALVTYEIVLVDFLVQNKLKKV